MIRLVIIFTVTFALGALIAVVVRTSAHRPYAMASVSMPPVAAAPSAAAPSAATPSAVTPSAATPSAAMPNVHHMPNATPDAQVTSVNTICAICGMPVNPALGTALYHEQRIGFGCKTCPGQFAANPEKYGPSALKNVIAE